VGQVGTGDARDKLVPQSIAPLVSIPGSDGEVAAHMLRFAHCCAGSHHSLALVAVPGLNAVAFNSVAVISASNVISARQSKNLTLLVETAMLALLRLASSAQSIASSPVCRSSVGALVASFAGFEFPGAALASRV
jgi:hypothetical protein